MAFDHVVVKPKNLPQMTVDLNNCYTRAMDVSLFIGWLLTLKKEAQLQKLLAKISDFCSFWAEYCMTLEGYEIMFLDYAWDLNEVEVCFFGPPLKTLNSILYLQAIGKNPAKFQMEARWDAGDVVAIAF